MAAQETALSRAQPIAKQREEDFMSDQDMQWIMTIAMGVVFFYMIMTTLQPVSAYAQSMMFEGKTDPRTVNVPSDKLVWVDFVNGTPWTPWSWALIQNIGPNDVEVGLNNPTNRFTVAPNAPYTVDRRGSMERIQIIFFYCKAGETAQVKLIGEY